jgi:HlyD family secretion protein
MKRALLLIGIGLVALGAAAWRLLQTPHDAGSTPTPHPAAAAAHPGVGCLGRIEPESRSLVSAPYYESRPSLVAELKVREGEAVAKDQVLAVLDSQRLLESALRQADTRIALAVQRVAQARAGPKPADVDALKTQRARLEAALASAEIEAARYRSLLPGGATSRASVEEKALAVTTLQREIEETDQRIRGLSEVRPSDIEVAESEAAVARADRQQIEARMEASVVRAPFAGRVLAIQARPGEEIASKGLLELARTVKMLVVAEVFEADISRVRVGQKAAATIPQSAQPLGGVVERIDQQVSSPSVEPSDPLAFADGRIVKVFIRLDDANAAASLIHAVVHVVIEP